MNTIFTVAVPSGESVLTVDGISYKNKLWLVPQWLDYPDEKMSKPALMIRIDNFPHFENPSSGHDIALNQQVPLSVLDGKTTEGFETLSGNQITLGIRRDENRH